jgi:maleylacetoacetate isomerase
MANALRMGCELEPYPLSLAVYRHASRHPVFVAAEPSRQPDFAG